MASDDSLGRTVSLAGAGAVSFTVGASLGGEEVVDPRNDAKVFVADDAEEDTDGKAEAGAGFAAAGAAGAEPNVLPNGEGVRPSAGLGAEAPNVKGVAPVAGAPKPANPPKRPAGAGCKTW